MSRAAFCTAPSNQAAAAVILVALAGCGTRSPATGVATGSVTFAARPVANGTIAFIPVDGIGPTAGGIVEQGAYRVERLHPGPKLVRIEAFARPAAFARSRADMELAAADRGRRPAPSEPADTDTIPAGAAGNDVQVTIEVGEQVLDFHLQPPAGR